MNGAYSTMFDANIPGVPVHVTYCLRLEYTGFYCVCLCLVLHGFLMERLLIKFVLFLKSPGRVGRHRVSFMSPEAENLMQPHFEKPKISKKKLKFSCVELTRLDVLNLS